MRSKSWWKAAGGVGAVVALALVAGRFACGGDRPAVSLAPEAQSKPQDATERDLKLESGAAPREELVVEPAPAQPRFAVRVEDEHGLALAEASVARVVLGKEMPLGTTDAQGELLMDPPGAARLLARHDGFTPATVAVGETDSRVVIRLLSGGTISGTVLLESGQPPEGTVRVWASSGGLPPACGELSEESHSASHVAETDSSGYFRIDGLDREAEYTVGGASGEYIVAPAQKEQPSTSHRSLIEARAKGIRPDTESVQLVAVPVYGVRLVFADELGNSLRHGPDCVAMWGGSANPLDSGVKYADHQELALGGIAGVDCTMRDRSAFVLVFSAREEREKVGPIAVSMKRPGYQSVDESVWAPRLRGRVPEHVIKLRETALGWGSVEVTFVGAAAGAKGELTIELKSDNHRDTLALIAQLEEGRPYLVSGVPAGSYRASVKMSDGLFRYPGRGKEIPLDVYHDKTAKLDVDLTGRSLLACEIQDELGLAYTGPVLLRILTDPDADRHAVHQVHFDQAPYRIPGLPTGEYTLSAVIGNALEFNPGKELYRMRIAVPAAAEMDVVLTRRTD